MSLFLSLGESMIELSGAGEDLWRMGVAGDTLNTAWYARACLPDDWRVAYFTRLGTDPFSDRIADFIAAAGIETTHIARDPARGPGLYAITLDKGERSFTYWRGQSAARQLADDEALLSAALSAADVIYFSGITLAILPPVARARLIRLAGAARAAGKLVAFDPNIRPRLWEDAATLRETLTAAAGAATVVLPGFDDDHAAFGDTSPDDTAHRYLAAGAEQVVVKTGGGPVTLGGAEGLTRIDDLPKVMPIDTTGAGDSFNAGYLAALLQGAPPDQAIRRGHAIAAQVVMGRGALVPVQP